MHKLVFIFYIIIALSCSQTTKPAKANNIDSSGFTFLNKENLDTFLNREDLDTLQEASFYRSIPIKKINDSIVRMMILANLEINWNNKTSRIVDDLLFKKVKQQYELQKMSLANEIRNTYETPAIGCPDPEKLTAGDIAYLIIDKIQNIPVMALMHCQFDLYLIPCPHPYGFLTFLKSQRAYVTKCVKSYIR